MGSDEDAGGTTVGPPHGRVAAGGICRRNPDVSRPSIYRDRMARNRVLPADAPLVLSHFLVSILLSSSHGIHDLPVDVAHPVQIGFSDAPEEAGLQ